LMCSLRCAKSIGPSEILRRRCVGSVALAAALANAALGDFARSAALIRELAVVASDTGCRGLELRNVGESFGGGFATYALSLALFVLPGVMGRGTGSLRPPLVCVGVFALDAVALAVEEVELGILPLAFVGRLRAGEFERVEGELDDGLWTLRTETGSFDTAGAGIAAASGTALPCTMGEPRGLPLWFGISL
jgi:hypothetical protein